MPLITKLMFIEEMNEEFEAQAGGGDEEEPVVGNVSQDLSGLGLVVHEI